MKNKKWLRSVAFILLLVTVMLGVFQCYGLPSSYDTRNLAAFDAEEKNTVDGLVFGTSVVGYGWITPVAWENYGIAAYHMGTSAQPFAVIQPFVDYALKKHDIKYIVVDVHGLRSKAVMTSIQDTKVKSAYLNFPDPIYRYKVLHAMFEYAEEAFEYYGEPTEDRGKYVNPYGKSYYLPFYIFHSRWVDGLVKSDYVTVKNKYLGADNRPKKAFGVYDCSDCLDVLDFGEPGEIDGFQKQQLEKLFAYCEEKDIELVFMSLPSFRSKEEQKDMSSLLKFCKEQGYDTIDFSDSDVMEKCGIDPAQDFVNPGHLNSKGGIKVTKYICEFLKEKGYYTPDHRGEELYSSWDVATEAYFKYFEKGWAEKE